jgi:MoaA/NifB/PqqE/SkfB family radical SAM enzyme
MLGAAQAKAETIAVIERGKENVFKKRMEVVEKFIRVAIDRGEYRTTINDYHIRTDVKIIEELEKLGYKTYNYEKDKYTVFLAVEWRD